MAKANLKDAPTPKKAPTAGGGKLKRSQDPMVLAAEALIGKGKEQGFLSPDDILAGFPDVELDTDQLFRIFNFFFQAEDGIRDTSVTGVQTCALPIFRKSLAELTRIAVPVGAAAGPIPARSLD